ncbi:MAG: TraR/DksA family transcriptional regulator [Candidatus Wenzhouxiangella sp. M2_3B_020]
MDLEDYRKIIERRIAALDEISEQSRDSQAPVELDQTRQGRLSRMDAMQGQAMARATEERRRHEVARLKAALERIDRGEYGECRECGEPIVEKRLQSDPAATLCVDCASARERDDR